MEEVQEPTEAVEVEEVEEQEAPTTSEAEGTDAPEEPEVPAEDEEKKRETEHKTRVQKRIDQLTREKYEMAREVERLRKIAEAAKPAEEVKAKPKLEDFGYDEAAFTEALTDWKLAESKKREREDFKATLQRQEQEAAQRDFQISIQQTNERGSLEFGDYREVVLQNPTLTVTDFMAAAMAASEDGHKVAYYLGQHPDEAARIAALPPVAQTREITKIELTKIKAPAKPKTTGAPDPVKPVGAKAKTIIDPNKLPIEEWMKLRNAGKIK